MMFAISIFAASVLLGILLAYLFLQYLQKKKLGNYTPDLSKSNPSNRNSPKGKKKHRRS
jgi:hypothetical protein